MAPEVKKRLEDAFSKFSEYIHSVGYKGKSGPISVDIRSEMPTGAIAYYDSQKRMLVIDSKHADDLTNLYREYMHHVLYINGVPEDPKLKFLAYYGIETGLAWYFPCSFVDDPHPSANGWNLDQKRSFDEIRQDITSAMTDGTEVWGGVFWDLRKLLGGKTSDPLLFKAWSDYELKPEDVATDRGASFARKLIEADGKHRNEIKALFDQRGLKL